MQNHRNFQTTYTPVHGLVMKFTLCWELHLSSSQQSKYSNEHKQFLYYQYSYLPGVMGLSYDLVYHGSLCYLLTPTSELLPGCLSWQLQAMLHHLYTTKHQILTSDLILKFFLFKPQQKVSKIVHNVSSTIQSIPLSKSWTSASPSLTRSKGVWPSRFFLLASAPC